jgi:hypothetical protein
MFLTMVAPTPRMRSGSGPPSVSVAAAGRSARSGWPSALPAPAASLSALAGFDAGFVAAPLPSPGR